MRVYLDASPVIYVVERVSPYVEMVQRRITAADVPVASHLTRLECRVRPIRDANAPLLRSFDRYFESAVAEVVDITRDVVDLATEIRAEYGFATPDALHLAAAVTAACDLFLTNDRRLQRFRDLSVEVIGP